MKKRFIFILFICFFINFSICNAEIQTFDRNQLENYGVNKKWKITSNNKDDILNTYAVDSQYKIYDFADILTDAEESELFKLITDFHKNTGLELVILTDDFYNTTDEENENFAVNFYDYNDFGLDKENYSGVIIFRNAHTTYPYYAIYTFGEAQLYFMDERINSILDYMYSDMTSKRYLSGFTFAIDNLQSYYDEGYSYNADDYFLDENGVLKEKYVPPFGIIFIISGAITFIIIFSLVKKNKMIYKATNAHEYLNSKSVNFSLRNDQFITSKTTSYSISSSSGGGGGGGRVGSSGGGHGGGGRRG